MLKIYQKILGFRVKYVPLSVYESIVGRPWQIRYDRMLHRIVDNTKILRATGMKQSELMPLYDGLRIELGRFAADPHYKPVDEAMQKRFDEACAQAAQPKEPPLPKEPPKQEPQETGKPGVFARLNDYRRRHVLKKVVKQKLYRIAPLRKAVQGVKRLLKKH